MFTSLLVFLFAQVLAVSSQGSACASKTTCSQCITTGPQCVWCQKKDFNMSAQMRCLSIDSALRTCPPMDIVDPQPQFRYINNRKVSNTDEKEIVQLSPQEVSLQLRINKPSNFTVTFRVAENYPVDLYFLMDLSYSMNDDKQNLARLGNNLGKEMRGITKNFLLGFGTFVDKQTAPYVSIVPSHLLRPCDKCQAPTFGFKNNMPLSEDAETFARKVDESLISGNLDTPEGGFDAMMQAIVCREQIGWRNVSRKIILMATDAGFHYAGDGKLGGIVIPNDEKCHLDAGGSYTESLHMDYPSISQINNKVTEKSINVLFAVTRETVHIYKELVKRIKGSYWGELASDSSNIVDLVKKQYEKISSTIELKDNAPPNVHLTYSSKCRDRSKGMKVTNKCDDVKVAEQVEFEVQVEVNQCPPDAKDQRIQFDISPVGVGEKLTVNLELICNCENCQKEVNSPICKGIGNYECGICDCPPNKYGKFCDCENKVSGTILDEDKCKMDESSVVCSGRGDCVCGQCACRPPKEAGQIIDGAFCECDNFNCPKSHGVVCGGHGVCGCRKCDCDSGWMGEACSCRSDNKSCESFSGVVCSNIGQCICGECKCPPDYGGQYCEEKGIAGKCFEYKQCVQCAFEFNQDNPELECDKCNEKDIYREMINETLVKEEGETMCTFKDDDDCNFYFAYSQMMAGGSDMSDQRTPIRIQQERDCPKPVNVGIIAMIVAGSVVFVGLALLLIWKVVTTIYDRREYIKFKTELDASKSPGHINPHYIPPESKYTNPMYKGDAQ